MPALQDPHEVILSRILQLDPSEFEELTRALLEALGFEKTEVTGKTGDGGVDVIGELNVANLARVKLFVQAKRYGTAKVSDKPVRDLRKVIPQGCQGAVITTSGLDSKAREAAEETGFANISLIDGHQLVDLLVEHWNAAGSGTEGESQKRHPPIPYSSGGPRSIQERGSRSALRRDSSARRRAPSLIASSQTESGLSTPPPELSTEDLGGGPNDGCI